MKTLNIYKAQPFTALHTCPEHRAPTCGAPSSAEECLACRPESVTIIIDRPIPELPAQPTPPFGNVLDEARAIYRKEAEALADALLGTLPGGVVDQLLAELMIRKASALRVPYGPPPLVAHDPATGETRIVKEGKLNVKLITTGNGVHGSQYVEPEAIEAEDDGSTTVVVRAWRAEEAKETSLVPRDEFTAKRFRRVAALLGLSDAIPKEDDCLLGCAGTVLGMFARKIEGMLKYTDPGAQALIKEETEAAKKTS